MVSNSRQRQSQSLMDVVDIGKDGHALELVKELDGLPLALATAGAYLGQVATTAAEYLCIYPESWQALQEASPSLLSYEDQKIHTTWSLSLAQIESGSGLAARLFRFMSYIDPQNIWYELLSAGGNSGPDCFSRVVSNRLDFDKEMRLLYEYSLIERHDSSSGYGIHSCVYSWLINIRDAQDHISNKKLALVCVGLSVPSEEESEYWKEEKRLLPHAGRVSSFMENDVGDEQSDDLQLLDAYLLLGNLYRDQKKLIEAEEMYERALAGSEKALGAEHTSTLTTVNNLGNLYRDQGKLAEAEAMYQRAQTSMK